MALYGLAEVDATPVEPRSVHEPGSSVLLVATPMALLCEPKVETA